jgi:hypothetical protein
MLWGKKDDELPEELRGLTPEQLAAAVKKAKELEQSVNALTTSKTELEQRAATQATEFEQMKIKMAELEANTPPEPPPNREEPATIWSDPSKFVADATKPVQDIALMSGMMSARMYAQQGLSDRDRKIFKKYEKEIETTMNGFAPQQRVMPQSWLLALTLAKGNHEQEISQAEAQGNDFFSEGASRGTPPPPTTEEKLTPEEQEACRVFHWDEKRYLQQKKNQAIRQSDKGSYAHYGV